MNDLEIAARAICAADAQDPDERVEVNGVEPITSDGITVIGPKRVMRWQTRVPEARRILAVLNTQTVTL